MASHTAAHYFIEGLVDLGIDYMFSNFGTDHVSLIEALAEWDREGRAHPRVVIKLLLVSNMVLRQRVAVTQTPNANGQSQCPAMQAQPVPAMS